MTKAQLKPCAAQSYPNTVDFFMTQSQEGRSELFN